MLKLVEVANYLTNQLNAIGEIHEPAYTFNIQAEIGANKNAADVQGLLKSAKAKLPPVLAGRNATYNLLVELSVVAPTSNFNLKNIEEIVNTFASQVNGQEIEFSQGKGLITMTLGQAGSFKTEVGQGNIVPLSYDVVINYTEGVATSRSKHWFLDGVEIPYLKEGVYITKEGRTNKINGKKYSETFALGQQKRYRFVLPYDETSVICQTLQKDILDGDGNKTYVLTYYDNVYYTENAPFETTVMLFENGDSESSKPEIAQFTITFADADDGNHTTKYYLALIDNPFDEATENTKCFEDTIVNGEVVKTAYENQIDYYDDLIDESGVPENEIPACNLSSVYLTNQTYVNTQKTDLFKIVNKNYARIRVETIENGQPKEYYFYYWTKNVQIGMDGQVTFDLKQDTVQTFLFMDEIQFEGNFIERACLNRWIDNGDGTVSFDGTVTSKLFERENLTNVAKRLVSREKMQVLCRNQTMTDFFNESVIAWCYVLLKRSGSGTDGKYPIYKSDNQLGYANMSNTKARINESLLGDGSFTSIDYNAHCTMVFPLLKRKYGMDVVNNLTGDRIAGIDEDIKALNNLFGGSDTSASPYIINVKLSCKPPFSPRENPSCHITQTGDNKVLHFSGYMSENGIIDLSGTDAYLWSTNRTTNISSRTACFYLLYDWLEGTKLSCSTNQRYKFAKTEITGTTTPALKNKIFNPKLLSGDYKTCTINMFGSTQEFDMQKLNTNNPTFLFSEAITMDVAKYKIIPTTTNTNEIYSGINQDTSYNGLVATNDTSIELSTDQYDTYIANNKNAYLSFAKNQEQQRRLNYLNAGQSILNGFMSGNWLGVMSGTISSEMNIAQTGIRQSYEIQQRDLTFDDMRSAPDVITNANGNAMFNITSGEIVPYVEIYEALPHELEMANEDMFMNGFSYNLQDDIFPYINGKNDVTKKNVRKNFNYLKALIGNISGVTISNEARNDLRQRLSNGVRFWHIDTIDYEHENYEKWLEA